MAVEAAGGRTNITGIRAEIGGTTVMIVILTKTRSIGEKLAVTVVLWPGIHTAQVADLSTQLVVGLAYTIVLLAAITVKTTRTTNMLFLGDPSTVTRGLAGKEWTTVTLQIGGVPQNANLPCFMGTVSDRP